MKPRTVVLIAFGLIAAGLVAGLSVRSAARLRALQSVSPERVSWRELGGQADVVELDSAGTAERTDFGVFSIALPPDPARVVEAIETPAGLKVEYAEGTLIVLHAMNAGDGAYARVAEAGEGLVSEAPWDDGRTLSAATSPEAKVWWTMENYRPAPPWEVVWFDSDRFQAELATAGAVAVLRLNAPTSAIVLVTDDVVAFWHVTDAEPPVRAEMNLFSRSSMLTAMVIMQGSSAEWVRDTAERVARSFRDACPPNASDEQIKERLQEAARTIEQP